MTHPLTRLVLQHDPPNCPTCQGNMRINEPKNGQNWKPFWGCMSYPSCKGTLNIDAQGRYILRQNISITMKPPIPIRYVTLTPENLERAISEARRRFEEDKARGYKNQNNLDLDPNLDEYELVEMGSCGEFALAQDFGLEWTGREFDSVDVYPFEVKTSFQYRTTVRERDHNNWRDKLVEECRISGGQISKAKTTVISARKVTQESYEIFGWFQWPRPGYETWEKAKKHPLYGDGVGGVRPAVFMEYSMNRAWIQSLDELPSLDIIKRRREGL